MFEETGLICNVHIDDIGGFVSQRDESFRFRVLNKQFQEKIKTPDISFIYPIYFQ